MAANHNAKGLHVVPAPAKHTNTQLTFGNYIADVLIGKTGGVSCVYIVQRLGSAEIIEMARFDSFGAAEVAAKQALQRWHLREGELPHRESKVSWRYVRKTKFRILLADDNPTWLRILVSIVEAKFEVVATAVDGRSALESISHFRPDVAVLDLGMPGLNGIDITRELMGNGRKPPVVICSAETAREIVEAAQEAGAAGYVFKHRCTRDLLPAVEAAANGRLLFPAESVITRRRDSCSVTRHELCELSEDDESVA